MTEVLKIFIYQDWDAYVIAAHTRDEADTILAKEFAAHGSRMDESNPKLYQTNAEDGPVVWEIDQPGYVTHVLGGVG